MKIRDLLGFGENRKEAEINAGATEKAVQQRLQETPPASVQDSCCGSCGGTGHTNKKETLR